ncbi:hypothetical protein [Streptomyces bugieae]|uniref:Uncharacterized protein n=1 Tax=Streptomyces bugieae TaxID=3098223 RepID=A0ABU7NP34_9ACTN|nr:hypothetical protein [Streptomyces sp. DSM 41528]
MTSANAGLDRRSLLRLGIGGLAAVLAGCAAESGPVEQLRFATGRRAGRTTPSVRHWPTPSPRAATG